MVGSTRRGRFVGSPVLGSLLLIALMTVPSVSASSALSAPQTIVAPAAIASGPPPVHRPASPTPLNGAVLPGASTAHQPFEDASAIVLQQYREAISRGMSPNGSLSHPVSRASPGRAPAVHPLAGGTSNGNVTGFVYDTTFGRPISGATISVVPLTGGCPGTCGGNTSASNGFYRVSAPPGPVVIIVDDAYYLENKTWVTVVSATTVAIGKIFLVHDGWANGTVRTVDSSHSPIPGIGVSALSLDGTISASPTGQTDAVGYFRIPVPPIPSRLFFDTPLASPYLSNSTSVNVTPYGSVDLGTVYLEGGFLVNASFIDRATGVPVPSSLPTQLYVCSRRETGFCRLGVLQYGPSVTAPGLAGPAYVKAMALGYLSNITAIPDLAQGSLSAGVNLGKIYLTPMGVLQISTNFTGGPPSNRTWAWGGVVAIVCSLEGVQVSTFPPLPTLVPKLVPSTCWPTGPLPSNTTQPMNIYSVGNTSRIVGPPLRDMVFLEPATGFPVAVTGFPGSNPAFNFGPSTGNFTWVNLTSDQVTIGGSVDLMPGRLLTGHVDLAGTHSPPPGYYVTACSTDNQWECAVGGTSAGCLSGNDTFCIPAPPGPLRVSALAYGTGENHTWVQVPSGCCQQVGTAINVGTINVSGGVSQGLLNGTVWVTDAPPGQHLPTLGLIATVKACLIGPPPVGVGFGGAVCEDTFVNLTTGAFALPVLVGWNRVEVFATGYVTNSTWVDVVQANTTGTIYLDPEGYVAGQVVTAQGTGIYEAVVQTCPLSSPLQCQNVGAGGLTSTSGQYDGRVRGAAFPAGAYEVVATAGGYASNWVWVNISKGGFTLAPNIVLTPLGVNSTPQGAVRLAPSGVGGWMDGRTVDYVTHLGIPGIVPVACRVGGGGCASLVGQTTFGGEFNGSLPSGYYRLFFNATDYVTLTRFVNLTAASYLHLGTLQITPYSNVAGRVAIGPWASLTEVGQLGPGDALVQVCDSSNANCGATGTVASDGRFNVSAPRGLLDRLTITGGAVNALSSPGLGFQILYTLINVTASFLALPSSGPGLLQLPIFGGFSGSIGDGTSWNATRGSAERPVPFAIVEANVNSVQPGSVSLLANAGGRFVLFAPAGGTQTNLRAVGSAFWAANTTVLGSVAPVSVTPASDLTLGHFGWASLTIRDAGTHQPIPGELVTVTVADARNGTNRTTEERTNGNGFVNITAPAGPSDHLASVGSSYFNQSRVVAVTGSVTSAVANMSLLPFGGRNGTWIQSAQLNTVNVRPVTTVVDGKTKAPIGLASVIVTTSGGATAATGVFTNGLGQFLSLVLPGPADQLAIRAPAYAPFTATYAIGSGARFVVPRVNLSGDGVIGGRVVVMPSGTPVAGVEVMACPISAPGCTSTAITNSSGGFWVDAAAGSDTVTLITNSYLANWSVSVGVSTDSFVWIGSVPVYEFASFTGSVRGLPTGQLLVGANVSLCSPLGGTTPGNCFESVSTDSQGRFTLSAPPSTYLVRVDAANYNATYYSVAASAGEQVSLGTIFLFEYGLGIGTVVNASDGRPLSNASVVACDPWLLSRCLPPIGTDANGVFLVSLPPGTSTLDVSASGHLDNFTVVTVASGTVTQFGMIRLTAFLSTIPVTVSGVVLSQSSGGPIPGAVVTASEAGIRIVSTVVNASGGFSMAAFQGVFLLSATATGYRPAQQTFTFTSNLSGIVFELEPMQFALSGRVTDRSTGMPISGAVIENGANHLALAGPDGRYLAELPNGTYSLTAVGPASSFYASLNFSISINGNPRVRDILLTLTGVPTTITVVAASSALPISGAIVSVNGTAGIAGVPRTGRSDAAGNFTLNLPPGNYSVVVLAAGYPEFAGHVRVVAPSTVDLVSLGSVSATSAPFLSSGSLPWVGLLVAALVIGIGAAIVLQRRRPALPPPVRRRWDPTGPDDSAEWRTIEP